MPINKFIRPKIPRKISLTDRDILIIQFVNQFRFVNAEQISELLTPSKRLKIRLKQLFEAHYLDRPKNQVQFFAYGEHPSLVYALGQKGRCLLKEEFGIKPTTGKPQKEKNDSVGYGYIRHCLEVVDFYIALKHHPNFDVSEYQLDVKK